MITDQDKTDILDLRELLWLHHGCSQDNLYGDDGELQCSAPKHLPFWVDFMRDSPELLKWKLASDEYKKLVSIPLPSEEEKPVCAIQKYDPSDDHGYGDGGDVG